MSQSRAKQLWDLFIEAECGSYEKSAWCDIFLSQVLSELHNGRPIQEILNFGGIGTLIGCEILSDVHQVVNVPGDNEELEPLRSYLLTKGWRGLAVLHAMGNLNLACSGELAKLLLFLYPLCLNQTSSNPKGNSFLNIKPSVVHDISLPKTPAKIKHATSHSILSPRVEYHRSLSHSSARSRRAMLRDLTAEIALNVSSDEPDSAACALQTGGGLFKLDPMDFDYFTSVVRSDDEIRLDSVLYEPPRRQSRVTRPHPRDLVDAAINTVMESAVSPYEFSILAVQLLTSLAMAEHTFTVCPENSYPTCTQCIKFSLENLCSLQFHSTSDSLTSAEAVELKVSWTQLLVMCLEKVMGCPDVTCSVILAGILPMMLRVLEDVINKIDVETKTELTSRLEDVGYGLLCGSIGFLHSLLLQGSDPDSLKTFLEMVNQLVDSGGGRLMDKTVLTLRGRSRRILELLSQLVIAVKRLRQRLSSPTVRKTRNRKHKSLCDAHHHYDVFGSIATTPIPSSKNVCCVNKLTMVFIRLLQNSEKLPTDITNLILRVMANCGVCCCMPIKEPIKALVKLVKEGNSKTRVLGFTLMEKTIYPQLGAYDIVGFRSFCDHCGPKHNAEATWEKLEIFRDIVLGGETRPGNSIICHLIRIAPVLRMPAREVLLFKIFFPVFVQSKMEYFHTKTEHLEFIILSSLAVFASILNESFVQHFISLNGTGHVLELIDLPNFSKHCCSVLEKEITCELNICSKSSEVSSLELLQMHTDMATDSFYTSCGVKSMRRQAMGIKRGRKPYVTKNMTELLQYVTIFWRSYACLALTNSALRDHFSKSGTPDDCQIMFDLALGYFTKSAELKTFEENESLNNCLSRLVESLLTFLLVTSDSVLENTTIEKLADALRKCDIGAVDLKKISEVVIKCSLARPNSSLILDSPKIPIMPVWSAWTEEMSEKEIESESTCSGEDDYVTADEGYDADVELKTSLSFGTETFTIESESSNQAEGTGEKSSPTIIYPRLCSLVVEFLNRAFNNDRAMDTSTRQNLEESLVAVLIRLTALCHDNPVNCDALCRQSVLKLLLTGFSTCLSDSQSLFVNLRTAVLDLVLALARNAITSAELGELIQFFKKDNPPVHELLKSLIVLVNEQGPKPDFVLKFPVLSPQDVDSSSDKSINRLHRREGLTSCWSVCGLQILIPGHLDWSPWLTGASLTFWVRIDRGSAQIRPAVANRKTSFRPTENTHRVSLGPSQPSRKISLAESHVSAFSTGPSDWGLSVDEETSSALPPVKQVSIKKQFHFFSFGSENLILECWIDLSTSGVNLRLTRADPIRGYDVVSEQTIEGGLISTTWHHVAVNIKDYVHNKRTVIDLTWIVDGYKETKTQLPFTGLVMRKPRDMFILLGHQATDFDSKKSLSISNLFLFRAPIFTKSRALGLLSYGPNCTNLADCRVDKPRPNLNSYLTPDSITSGVDWNDILDNATTGHRELSEALLLTYSAHDPNSIAIYQGSSSVSTSSLLFRPSTLDPCAAQLSPINALPTILAPLIVKKNETIIPAASLLGGSSLFLYLFARVVELKSPAAEQADALFLFLRLVQSNPSLYSEFINHEYHKLLRKILRSRFCKLSLYLLKAIFDASCDGPIIVETTNGLAVNTNSATIIKNSVLLSTLVEIWLDTANSSSLLQPMFASLQTLVCDEHPFREFNVSQLNRVRTMKTLLSFCKARLVGEEKSTIEHDVCISVVELVRSLMGAPPEFPHVVGVMDTLLLLHPANATYITHLKNSFYLVLSAAQNNTIQPVPHDPNSLRLMRQTTSMSLDKWVQTLKTNTQVKDDYANPVDAGKLSKALTNLQVKNATAVCSPSPKEEEEEIDSNRYSDDVTLDSGISDTCRENIEQENNIVKAVDGSQQNLGSFFPSINANFEDKAEFKGQEKCIREMHQKENWDYVITEGFLLLLRDVLLVLPDNMAHQVLSYVTKFEILLVMANHQNHAVRAAVVQLISSYLKRANDDERNKFMKANGFYHLANQLALYPASQLLAEACLNLITPCVVALDDQSFIAQMEFTSMELASLPPLLALLPRSVHDCILTQHLINTLKTIFCKSFNCAQALLSHGLVEVLVKALLASSHISYVSHQITSQDIVISDLQEFFVIIASQCLGTPGVASMPVVSNMRLAMHYVGRVERDSCGPNEACVKVVRDTQCRFLERCLDLLLEKVLALQTDRRGQAAFITLGITPDDLLGPRSMTSSQSSVSLSLMGSQTSSKELSKSDLKERIGMLIPWCVQFLITEAGVDGDRISLEQTELEFVYRLFPKFLEMMTVTLEKPPYVRSSGAQVVLWAVREPLRSETAELLVWLMCPRQTLQTRLFAITSLLGSAKTKEVISSLLQSHPQIESKFTVFLWDLMYNNNLSGSDLRSCRELKDNLQQWSVLSPHAVGNSHDSWGTECKMLLTQMDRQKGALLKQIESSVIRCVTKYDNLLKTVGEDAMLMTRIAVDAQNVERKAQISEIRQAKSAEVTATVRWRALVDRLTHEGAIWCDERALPRFWQLDPTEGPHRIRTRLMATHQSFASKYLKPEHQYKSSTTADCPQPLSFLFERHHETCPSSAVIERLHSNEKIKAMASARVITPAHEVPGELLVGESSLYFVAEDKHLCSTLDAGSTTWPFEDVREVHPRRFQLKERAIELFLRTGRTYLIAFQTCKEKETFVAALRDCELPNQTTVDTLVHYTNQWREKQITNWEYLTQLNKIAGRSFNDLMQYPVFPFVLADYGSSVLDLTSQASFRNLKKPMAVQNKPNEQHYINNYNDLLAGLSQVSLNREPYHYGSHYSNSGTVLHFLVRLPPFTAMLIQYQDRNFDLPDRTFHNMETTWRLTSCDSVTDVKEMIPEFYSCPEFLKNNQGFDFGVRQNGDRVDDVILPPWSGGDARRFILIHRQALESDAVTENLPHWIDLVFGYKQTGKAAVDAINVFHPATYCGFDVENIQDPNERIAWETMVRTYGQTPRQLFRTPHPLVIQSLVSSSSQMIPVLPDVKGLKWGNYVGSPIEYGPRVAWKQTSKDHTITASLLPLATNDVFALPVATTCLIRYSKEKGLSLINSTTIRAALVSWGHSDGLLRVKIKKDQPSEPLMFVSHLNPVTTCSSVPECGQLWVGHQSGSISVLKFSFRNDRYHLDFAPLPVKLQAHQSAVTAIAISGAFSITVTTSRDGFLKIWDLNNISYVRSINLGEPVVLAAISSTLGDIASVVETPEKNFSKLYLHSINATLLGTVNVHDGPITSVCFSSAMEGISVNVVACGLANGIIRLWNTWNLTFVRDILNPAFRFPIISLTYSRDAQHLYAGCADGTVIVWESSGMKYDSHPPKFLNLKTLL